MSSKNLSYDRKYRPTRFEDVIGQTAVIKSLLGLLKDKSSVPHTFLFSGDSGLGKTTLARIIAWELGCENVNVLEIDGATYTGIDDMKNVCSGLEYASIGKSPIKFVIIDEAHSLSKKAWDSMLKITEEPPEHVYFVFCTTELAKVPKALQGQRCTSYNLKAVSIRDITELLDYVVKEEKLALKDNQVDVIAREAQGSPRKALNYLSKCRGCASVDEVRELLETFDEESTAEELFQLIVKGGSWDKVREVVKGLEISDFSGTRIAIFARLTAYVLNARNSEESVRLLDKLYKLKGSFYIPQTSKGEFLLMLGDIFIR